MALYYLFETASGYSLFSSSKLEEIGASQKAVQESTSSKKRFKKIVKLAAFYPFVSAEQAIGNMCAVAEGECSADLIEFLKLNMPSVKKSKYLLAVEDSRVPGALAKHFPKLGCVRNETTLEVFRGIRLHFNSFLEGLSHRDLGKGQLALGHAYSRSKVQNDIKRYDKPIISAIALLDQLDKDTNTFSMRLKEWYSWHFPELNRIVSENLAFAKAVKLVPDKQKLTEDSVEALAQAVGSQELAREVLAASKLSMGGDMSEVDALQINMFCDRIVALTKYREDIAQYLKDRMGEVAPNLAALIGEIVGARLVAHAGGLFNLAKFPSSTVQILGAEKALFRALKTGANTPKYGLLYHSSFIGRASPEDKGKISRFVANKCAIAARIDAFFPTITSAFGERMNLQVEERLANMGTGVRGEANEDVMHEVLEGLRAAEEREIEEEPKKKKKKRKDRD